jgi:hypothetical protein
LCLVSGVWFGDADTTQATDCKAPDTKTPGTFLIAMFTCAVNYNAIPPLTSLLAKIYNPTGFSSRIFNRPLF